MALSFNGDKLGLWGNQWGSTQSLQAGAEGTQSSRCPCSTNHNPQSRRQWPPRPNPGPPHTQLLPEGSWRAGSGQAPSLGQPASHPAPRQGTGAPGHQGPSNSASPTYPPCPGERSRRRPGVGPGGKPPCLLGWMGTVRNAPSGPFPSAGTRALREAKGEAVTAHRRWNGEGDPQKSQHKASALQGAGHAMPMGDTTLPSLSPLTCKAVLSPASPPALPPSGGTRLPNWGSQILHIATGLSGAEGLLHPGRDLTRAQHHGVDGQLGAVEETEPP